MGIYKFNKGESFFSFDLKRFNYSIGSAQRIKETLFI